MMKNKKGTVVKINSELLKKIEEFINLEENKFKYVNKKQFVDIAVADYLRRQGFSNLQTKNKDGR